MLRQIAKANYFRKKQCNLSCFTYDPSVILASIKNFQWITLEVDLSSQEFAKNNDKNAKTPE